MDGVVFGNTAVLFIVDPTTPFNGTTYTVPANVSQQFITGCVPNGFYNVARASTPSGLTMNIAPAASGSQADAAGVLTIGTLSATVPSLTVVASPPNMVLSWPTNAAGFVLNQTSSLAPPSSWTPVTTGITVSGANYTVTLSTSSGNQFYSLIAR
jgi:hypothetical protein